MLIEFSIENFRSFRERQVLSLAKGTGQELSEHNTFTPDAKAAIPLVRSSAIYGPNAAGKSNLIKALRAMEEIVIDSASWQRGEKLPVSPFLLDEECHSLPSEFEVVFISDNIRYQYGFSATEDRIIEEWLLAYPKGKAQRLIERIYDESTDSYRWGGMDKLTGQKKLWKNSTRDNALFLSTAIQLNNEQLRPVFDWFEYTLRIIGMGKLNDSYTASLCKQDEDHKQTIISFLQAANLDISDIQLKTRKIEDALPSDLPSEMRQTLLKDLADKEFIDVALIHKTKQGNTVSFDIDEESDGTQKLFAFAGPWLDTLLNGYVLFVDELHDNFHPLMVKFLVELFHDNTLNPKNAQLVFTTHDTSILDQEIFRRDQVWFCEKEDDQESTLYPLSDFSPRKNIENLEKSYLSGRYGALPYFHHSDIKVRA